MQESQPTVDLQNSPSEVAAAPTLNNVQWVSKCFREIILIDGETNNTQAMYHRHRVDTGTLTSILICKNNIIECNQPVSWHSTHSIRSVVTYGAHKLR